MCALTTDRSTVLRDGTLYERPMAASVECFVGALLVYDASGNVEPATAVAGKVPAGRCEEYAIEDTAVAAASNVKFRTGIFRWANSGVNTVDKTHIGDTAWIEDDETVGTSPTTTSRAGIIMDVDATGVWVKVDPVILAATGLLAANNLSDVGTVATARANLGLDTGDSPTFDTVTLGGGAGSLVMTAAASSLLCLDNSATGLVMGSSGNPNMLQFVTTTGLEKIVIEGTTAQVALHVDLGTFLCDETALISGILTLGAGAAALTMTAASSSILCLDNSATGLVMGSSGNPNMLQFVTTTGGEKIVIEGTTTAVALHVDVGTFLCDESGVFTGTLTPNGGIVAATTFAARPGGICHTGGLPARVAGDGTNAALVNTEVYVCEVFVPCNMSITGISWFNGATAGTDSRHSALLYSDGTVVAGSATGADVITGTDVYEKQAFTGGAITVLGPATYFVAFIASGATDKYNAHPFGEFRAGKITGETYQAITAITPPTTFTADLGPIAALY